MKTSAILELLKEYIILSLKILLPISLIFLIGYVIYKKNNKRYKENKSNASLTI